MRRYHFLAPLSVLLIIAEAAASRPPRIPPHRLPTDFELPSNIPFTSTTPDTALAPSSASQSSFSSSSSVSKASVSSATGRSVEAASIMGMANSTPSPTSSSSGSQASSTSTDSATQNSSQNTSQSPLVTTTQLTIILSVVLGVLVIVLLILAIFLISRYRRGMTPFSRFSKRGATPINDDEIATWRGEKFRKSTVLLAPRSYTGDTPQSWQYPKPSSNVMGGAGIAQPVIARAPNSRTGLTDETVPGAAPFIPHIKRQSSRLSKLPAAHQRNRSRRSSVSNSIRSPVEPVVAVGVGAMNWFDPEDRSVRGHRRDYSKGSKNSRSNSMTKLSMDGFTPLSPRPRSSSNTSYQPLRGNSGSLGSLAAAYASFQLDDVRPEEIGRAYAF